MKGKDPRLQGGTGPKIGGYQAEGATKRELILEATMIVRMVVTSAFSDRTESSVTTASEISLFRKHLTRSRWLFRMRRGPISRGTVDQDLTRGMNS